MSEITETYTEVLDLHSVEELEQLINDTQLAVKYAEVDVVDDMIDALLVELVALDTELEMVHTFA